MTPLIVNFARRVGGANHRCQMGVNWTTLLSSDTGHRTLDSGQSGQRSLVWLDASIISVGEHDIDWIRCTTTCRRHSSDVVVNSRSPCTSSCSSCLPIYHALHLPVTALPEDQQQDDRFNEPLRNQKLVSVSRYPVSRHDGFARKKSSNRSFITLRNGCCNILPDRLRVTS